MHKSLVTGVITLAVAIAFSFPANAAASTKKGTKKPVQAQTSSCSNCNKKGAAKAVKKDCNKTDCSKTKDGKPCPKDCPNNIK